MRIFNRFIACSLIITLLGVSACFFGRGGRDAGHHGGEGDGEHHQQAR
jgi:hypothetical protein